MTRLSQHKGALAVITLLTLSAGAYAAGADMGQAVKQATNWTAIGMFAFFVIVTLFITKWAASRTKKTKSEKELHGPSCQVSNAHI